MADNQNYDPNKQRWNLYQGTEDEVIIERGTKLRFRIISTNFRPDDMGAVATINDHYLGSIDEDTTADHDAAGTNDLNTEIPSSLI